MEKDQEFELIVHEGNRPLWQTIIAGLIFTFMFYIIYQLVLMFYYRGYNDDTVRAFPSFFYLIVCCIVAGSAFSLVKTVLIDVDKDKLVTRFTIGVFSYDRISEVPSLEYVSVFKDARGGFDVNLWYVGNKHYVLCDFYDSEAAFEFARYVAKKLKIDLLDATVKGDSKWIDTE